MIRTQNRNSSCDCGKTTKERGSFVTKSKVYETRSGAHTQKTEGNNFTAIKDDKKTNILKSGNEILCKKMESHVNSVSTRNKSLNVSVRKSSRNPSKKTLTNKRCDNNMIVRNGNARGLIDDTFSDSKITNDKNSKLDTLECKCVRSNANKSFEDSIIHSNENKVPQEDESEKKLREDKQNGVCERCDNGKSDLNGRRSQKCAYTRSSLNSSSDVAENCSKSDNVNGFLNGSEHVHHDEKLDFVKVVNQDGEDAGELENPDSNLGSDRKKRKSNFEKIFDSYAEFGCYSDKRRSRKPPESYSPEPTRRIKLETLFDEKNTISISAKFKKKPARKYKQKGPIFHYLDLYIKNKDIKEELLKHGEEEEGLIDPSLIKQEEEEVDIAEPSVEDIFPDVRCTSPMTESVSLSNNKDMPNNTNEMDLKNNSDNINMPNDLCNTDISRVSDVTCIDMPNGSNNTDIANSITTDTISNNISPDIQESSNMKVTGISNTSRTNLNPHSEYSKPEVELNSNLIPSSYPLVENVNNIEYTHANSEIVSSSFLTHSTSPIMSHELPEDNDNCLDTANMSKYDKVLNNKNKKGKKEKPEKPRKLTYDGEVSRILGYRYNKGKNEFLVLFHNGTSNWIIQEDNITVIPPYKEYFEHGEHELSTINRLAYFITMDSVRQKGCVHNPNMGTSCLALPTTTKQLNGNYVRKKPDLPKEVPVVNHIDTTLSHDVSAVASPESLVLLSPKEASVVNHNSSEGKQLDTHTDNSHNGYTTDVNNCFSNSFCGGYKDTMSKSDLNELCNYVMSSRHIKLYPCETTKEIVFKRDDEFMHIYLKNIKKNQPDNLQRTEHLNIKACEKLIYTLEDCAVDNTCEVVVISGIEEYFALQKVFDRLLKKPATVEGKNYEQDVSMLRYLIQTIRNFTKPICAVIKKTAIGLPASMLSLFDMVFDERGENFTEKSSNVADVTNPKPSKQKRLKEKVSKEKVSKKKKHDKRSSRPSLGNGIEENGSENFQSYLFPRLMGLTESNESQIMGEGQKLNAFDTLSCSSYNKKMLSMQLRRSLRYMKSNTKIQMKNRSRKHSLNSEEEFENIIDEENFRSSVSSQPSVLMQAKFDNLEKEIEREKELTKRSMDELESILLSMGPC